MKGSALMLNLNSGKLQLSTRPRASHGLTESQEINCSCSWVIYRLVHPKTQSEICHRPRSSQLQGNPGFSLHPLCHIFPRWYIFTKFSCESSNYLTIRNESVMNKVIRPNVFADVTQHCVMHMRRYLTSPILGRFGCLVSRGGHISEPRAETYRMIWNPKE